MTKLTKFAIVELNSQTDILANLQSIELGIKIASERGTRMVILPENAFCFGKQGFASQYFDALKAWSAQAARHYGVYLLAGTLPCPYRPDGTPVADGKLRQSSLLFDPAGNCLARYDKIHLFKATVNDSTGNYDEGRTFEAGNELIVADTEFGKVGMMVCFDIRFPTLAVKLRELGADILTAPSAFTYQTGKAHRLAALMVAERVNKSNSAISPVLSPARISPTLISAPEGLYLMTDSSPISKNAIKSPCSPSVNKTSCGLNCLKCNEFSTT